jgi:hypothetical protein
LRSFKREKTMTLPRIVVSAALILAAAACQKAPADNGPPGFGMKVMFLDGSGAPQDFPALVTKLVIRVKPYTLAGTDAANMCQCGARCEKTYEADIGGTVLQKLEDFNADGSFEEAVISNVPDGCPFALEVLAYESGSARVGYYGRVDGLWMTKGRRLFLKVALQPKNTTMTVLNTGWGTSSLGVFGHTATRIEHGRRPDAKLRIDGRILIAGGFERIEPAVCENAPISLDITEENCPSPTAANDCFKCFIGYATNDLYLFDGGSGTIQRPTIYQQGQPVGDVRMAQRRAFHTATALADGRILIAGGVDRAAFIFRNNDILDGSDTQDGGWELAEIKPLPGEGYLGALTTFELFNGEYNQDDLDLDRDGDFERGGMHPLSGMESPMGAARFLQAAIASPVQSDQDPTRDTLILQIGGINDDPMDPTRAPRTVELFDAGPTSFSGSTFPNLLGPRAFPAVAEGRDFTIPRTVLYIFGGVQFPGFLSAPQNNAVVEKWIRDDAGSWAAQAVTLAAESPQYVRLFADALTLTDDGRKIMLAGWYGARCAFEGDGETPTYVYEDTGGNAIPTHICSAASMQNNLMVDFIATPATFTPVTPPATAQPSAMGSTIMLSPGNENGTRAKWIMQSGGIANTKFTVSTMAGRGTVVLYKPVLAPDLQLDTYTAMPAEAFSATLNSPRMWHRSVELGGGSVLFIGGVKFELGSNFAEIVSDMEILSFKGMCGDGNCEMETNVVYGEDAVTCPADCTAVP